MKGFSRNPPEKFTQSSPNSWEDKFLGIPFLAKIQEGVEIDDALGFPGLRDSVPGSGGPVAGNESLDPRILVIDQDLTPAFNFRTL